MAWYDAPLNAGKSFGGMLNQGMQQLFPSANMPVEGPLPRWENTVRPAPPPALSVPPGGAAGGAEGGGENPLDLANFAQNLLTSEPNFAPGISPEWMAFLDAGTKAQMAPLEAIMAAGQGQISQREAAAKQMLGQMPGDLQGIKQQGQEGIMNMASLFGQQGEHFSPFELGESGMHPMMGTAPGLAGLESLTANRLQGLPYLDMANQQWAGQQQTALQMAHQDAIRQAEQDKFRAMTDIGMQQMGIDADWRKAQLGALGQGGYFDDRGPDGNFGPNSLSPERGWEILQGAHGEGRAEKLRDTFPRSWQEAEEIFAQAPDEETLGVTMKGWVFEGKDANAKRARAEIASIILAQSGHSGLG